MDCNRGVTSSDSILEHGLHELQRLIHVNTQQRIMLGNHGHYVGNLRGQIDATHAENVMVNMELDALKNVNFELTQKLYSAIVEIKALRAEKQTLQSTLRQHHDATPHDWAVGPSSVPKGGLAVVNGNLNNHVPSGPSKDPATIRPQNDKESTPSLNPQSPPFTPSHLKGKSISKLSPLSQPFDPSPQKGDGSQVTQVSRLSTPNGLPTAQDQQSQTSIFKAEPSTINPFENRNLSVKGKEAAKGNPAPKVPPHLRGLPITAAQPPSPEITLVQPISSTPAVDTQVDNTAPASVAPSSTPPTVSATIARDNSVLTSCSTSAVVAQVDKSVPALALPSSTPPTVNPQITAEDIAWLDSQEEVTNSSSTESTPEPSAAPNGTLIDLEFEPNSETEAGNTSLLTHPAFTPQRVTRDLLSIDYLQDLRARNRAGENVMGEFIDLNAELQRRLKTFGIVRNTAPTHNNENHRAATPSDSHLNGDKEGIIEAAPKFTGGTSAQTPEILPILSDFPLNDLEEGTIGGALETSEDPSITTAEVRPQAPLTNHGEQVTTEVALESAEGTFTKTPESQAGARTWLGHEIKRSAPSFDVKPAIVGTHKLGGVLDLSTKLLIMNDTPWSRCEEVELDLDWKPVYKNGKQVFVLEGTTLPSLHL